ncbi:glycosyltransferase 87 family protein [Leekyejoonella antrihumi]|uniref:glycosyltransferase 87 family protein n=1 Tax=Leekyejoonella antrihumi TaxID=1660198 RepID=UPI0016446397|nr:glycosyltransferase 87 family protein [Leekyejoonella antrihumi]
MTASTRRRLLWWALAIAIIAGGLTPTILKQLVQATPQHWQVDLSVYRQAGVSNLRGRAVYDYLAPPQSLPFTYPPFASILAIPLAIVPFKVAGWCWFFVQAAADVAIAGYAVRPLLRRAGPRAPLVLAVAAVASFYLLPVNDGLRFGQVDAFLLLACLLDLHRPPWIARLPQGVLIGVSTAIKLTPGMFIVQLLVTRRWRAAAWAIGAAAGTTGLGALLLPSASFAFWGGALEDTSRLGPNDGTSNQSLRGMLLRVGPGGLWGTAIWAVLVVVVLIVGLGLARAAYARRDTIAEVALVGLVTVLVSPVSWIHHFDWVVLIIGVLLGAGRSRRRVMLAALVYVGYLLDLPWWGQWRLVATGQSFPQQSNGNPWGVLMNNGFGLLALVCLVIFALRTWKSPTTLPEKSLPTPE